MFIHLLILGDEVVYTPAYTRGYTDDRGYTGMFMHLLILFYTPAYTRDDRGYTGMFIHLLILGMIGDIQVCLYTCLY